MDFNKADGTPLHRSGEYIFFSIDFMAENLFAVFLISVSQLI